MNVKQKLTAVALTAAAALPAFAQEAGTFDPTSYVGSIAGLVAGMLAIGGAVFGLHVAIKSTKWARKSL